MLIWADMHKPHTIGNYLGVREKFSPDPLLTFSAIANFNKNFLAINYVMLFFITTFRSLSGKANFLALTGPAYKY